MLGKLNGTICGTAKPGILKGHSLNPLNTCRGDCRTRQCMPGGVETTHVGSTRGGAHIRLGELEEDFMKEWRSSFFKDSEDTGGRMGAIFSSCHLAAL